MNASIHKIQKHKLQNDGDKDNARYSIDVSEWDLKELALYTKKAGSKSDGHFHKGENPSRDPEYLYMIQGKMKLSFEDLASSKKEVVVEAGEVLITPAWIYHSYEVLEDCVFLEPREASYKEIPDTYDYDEFLKSKNLL